MTLMPQPQSMSMPMPMPMATVSDGNESGTPNTFRDRARWYAGVGVGRGAAVDEAMSKPSEGSDAGCAACLRH